MERAPQARRAPGTGATHRHVLDVLREPAAIFLIQLLQPELQLGVLGLHLLELALGGQQHLGTANTLAAALVLRPSKGALRSSIRDGGLHFQIFSFTRAGKVLCFHRTPLGIFIVSIPLLPSVICNPPSPSQRFHQRFLNISKENSSHHLWQAAPSTTCIAPLEKETAQGGAPWYDKLPGKRDASEYLDTRHPLPASSWRSAWHPRAADEQGQSQSPGASSWKGACPYR